MPEFPDISHREVIVAPYRFFYRVKGDTVWIVAVWRGAQLPVNPASDRRKQLEVVKLFGTMEPDADYDYKKEKPISPHE